VPLDGRILPNRLEHGQLLGIVFPPVRATATKIPLVGARSDNGIVCQQLRPSPVVFGKSPLLTAAARAWRWSRSRRDFIFMRLAVRLSLVLLPLLLFAPRPRGYF